MMQNLQKILDLFQQDLSVINMGLEGFGEALAGQNVTVIQMDWRPPAGGNAELIEILDRLERAKDKA